MKKTSLEPITGQQAVGIVGSIFRVRRDLVALIKEHVISGSGVTLEQADLLLDLYGAAELGWADPKTIKGGWVTMATLKNTLLHSSELLSRRLADLKRTGLIEISSMSHNETREAGIDAKSKKVRIMLRGLERGRLIYDRYCRVCQQLLNRLPPEVLDDAMRAKAFNEAIMAALRFQP
jgi:hypothetical protein